MNRKTTDDHRYDDIINLPHHQSATHPHMSLHDRAAQFAPFSALTGHKEAIEETERQTTHMPELDENEKDVLDEKLMQLMLQQNEDIPVRFTCFVPDDKKPGGTYRSVTGTVKKIDSIEHTITLHSGEKLSIQNIIDMDLLPQ